MSAQVPRLTVNTRQRLLSADINNISALTAKAMIMLELAREVGDGYTGASLGRSGVVGGFMVRCLPATNIVEISPGIAIMASTAVSPTYDPPEVWIQSDAAVQLDLSALIDATNPRLVTIEVGPSDGVIVSTPIDVFDPGTGLFIVDPSAPRVQGSVPIWFTSGGAPAASPTIAAGTVGRVPLAVVKLVASQASFADEYASILMCRPLLGADAGLVPRDYVEGGGCSVGEESGGSLVGLTDVYLSRLNASLAGIEGEVSGLIPFGLRARTASTTSPATLLGVAGVVYGYAAPPPWPGDYGPMAPREAWQRNPNAVAFATAGNVVGGAGSTFISLAAETPSSPGRTFRSAIVFWDSVAPYGLERGTGNAPLQVIDARGPHPDTAPGGSGTVPLTAAQDPTWGPSQSVSESVYVGALAALGLANNFMAQADQGSGVLRVIDVIDQISPNIRRPFFSTALAAANAPLYPGRFPGMLVGNPTVLPTSMQSVDVLWSWEAGSGAGNPTFIIGAELGFGRTDNVNYVGATSARVDTATVTNLALANEMNRVVVSASGSLRYSLAIAAGGTALRVGLSGYLDALLAAR